MGSVSGIGVSPRSSAGSSAGSGVVAGACAGAGARTFIVAMISSVLPLPSLAWMVSLWVGVVSWFRDLGDLAMVRAPLLAFMANCVLVLPAVMA